MKPIDSLVAKGRNTLLLEVKKGILEEFEECESLQELHAMRDCSSQYQDPEVLEYYKQAEARLSNAPAFKPQNYQLMETMERLNREIAKLKAQTSPPVPRSSRQYRILKLEVNWSTKPQVHAIMRILGAHAKPGDVLDEEHIVEMMERNVDVLATRQGGRKVWNYYKGDHPEGLLAHGNLEKL